MVAEAQADGSQLEVWSDPPCFPASFLFADALSAGSFWQSRISARTVLSPAVSPSRRAVSGTLDKSLLRPLLVSRCLTFDASGTCSDYGMRATAAIPGITLAGA